MPQEENAALPGSVRGDGPGLLLVHGGGATAQTTWGPLLPVLSRDFRVVAPDYSAGGEAKDLDGLVDRHVRTADRAGLDRFGVTGHSFGSAVALRMATRHPDRVAGLVLTAGFARAAASTRLKVEVWRGLALGNRELLPWFLMSVMLGDRYLESLSAEQREGMAELIGLTVPSGTVEQIELILSTDLRRELALVSAPTLVVATTADQLVPASMSGELAAGIPGARLSELHCGHHPTLEDPAGWIRLIKDFLGSTVTKTSSARP
ncbi:alpha/beta hydrolase [Streptomyces sp. HNM0575]|uniref:alpha/beta fold hydrolase n=1 Tax=Streptomyces sp. HNM0575 TaxID=2716338 RepID=UPI00145E9C84|nr:alpha/beta hydrolase [Streptomyces sp. HNM0575]NLU73288.1 alpha/beta hydrolase [Streptomyces sp. HNM0575]